MVRRLLWLSVIIYAGTWTYRKFWKRNPTVVAPLSGESFKEYVVDFDNTFGGFQQDNTSIINGMSALFARQISTTQQELLFVTKRRRMKVTIGKHEIMLHIADDSITKSTFSKILGRIPIIKNWSVIVNSSFRLVAKHSFYQSENSQFIPIFFKMEGIEFLIQHTTDHIFVWFEVGQYEYYVSNNVRMKIEIGSRESTDGVEIPFPKLSVDFERWLLKFDKLFLSLKNGISVTRVGLNGVDYFVTFNQWTGVGAVHLLGERVAMFRKKSDIFAYVSMNGGESGQEENEKIPNEIMNVIKFITNSNIETRLELFEWNDVNGRNNNPLRVPPCAGSGISSRSNTPSSSPVQTGGSNWIRNSGNFRIDSDHIGFTTIERPPSFTQESRTGDVESPVASELSVGSPIDQKLTTCSPFDEFTIENESNSHSSQQSLMSTSLDSSEGEKRVNISPPQSTIFSTNYNQNNEIFSLQKPQNNNHSTILNRLREESHSKIQKLTNTASYALLAFPTEADMAEGKNIQNLNCSSVPERRSLSTEHRSRQQTIEELYPPSSDEEEDVDEEAVDEYLNDFRKTEQSLHFNVPFGRLEDIPEENSN